MTSIPLSIIYYLRRPLDRHRRTSLETSPWLEKIELRRLILMELERRRMPVILRPVRLSENTDQFQETTAAPHQLILGNQKYPLCLAADPLPDDAASTE
jgi:hypothetical protein